MEGSGKCSPERLCVWPPARSAAQHHRGRRELECGSETAGVPGTGSVAQEQDLSSRRGHRCCGLGDRRPDPEDHQNGVLSLHCHHHRPQTQHHHGLRQVK